jgi:hypothetical protein
MWRRIQLQRIDVTDHMVSSWGLAASPWRGISRLDQWRKRPGRESWIEVGIARPASGQKRRRSGISLAL